MAIEGCVKPAMHNDNSDEDDDVPLCFKRPQNSSSKQPNASSFKPSSASQDAQKNKGPSTSKGATVSSNSRPLIPDRSKQSSDNLNNKSKKSGDPDDEKPLSHKFNGSSSTIQKNSSVKPEKAIKESSEVKQLDKGSIKEEKSDDSDDEKPLSTRFSSRSAVEKADSSLVKKELQSPLKPAAPPSIGKMKSETEASDDSEDDKPLTARFTSKTSGSTKVMLNGSVKKEESTEIKSTKIINKRPLDDASNSLISSSIKKGKVSAASSIVKSMNQVVKKKVDNDDDHIPISQRIKKSDSSSKKQTTMDSLKKMTSSKKIKKTTKQSQFSKTMKVPPGSGGGQKWTTLEHNGVIFPPPYKPHGIKILYNGQPVDLTPEQEEVATMFAVMKDTEYATKKQFIDNFFGDWRKILGKNHVIKKFELCDFTPIYEWHLREKEKKKQMTTEEKKALKEDKLKQEEKYMWAVVDGVKEKVGNFRVEPPGLFRGRGEHPKMGKLKKRIKPSDITINIGKNSSIPECPIPGERWKEVKHDNTVTWLAFWNDPINPKEFKYVFLAASSTLKGQSDKEKYEKARLLKDYIRNIRANYTKDFTSKDPTKRQIAVATYLIDKLALRAGNEKDDDEADTVGCCTLKVENVELVPPNKLKFDFLGKDSIRYLNTVEVELPVYKAIGDFQTAKKSGGGKKGKGDDLFDLLDTSKLNAHLKELMPGLTAKVFRTFNASITLDEILHRETRGGDVPEKVSVYQHANKEVAIICNHQRSVSKSHDTQMSKLNEKIDELKAQRDELKEDLSRAKKGKPPLKDKDGKPKKNLSPEVLAKKISQVDAKIEKIEMNKQLKENLKTVALGTSKTNYLDPRITVAWCKSHEVPIEKVFNKSLLAKFAWAMDVDPSFRF